MDQQPVYLTTNLSPTWGNTFYVWLFGLVIGMGCGYFVNHWWETSPMREKLAAASARLDFLDGKNLELTQELAREKINMRTKTEIAYVPKEVVVYKDPITGQAKLEKEKSDVAVEMGLPKAVSVKINGKVTEMPLLAGETQKFEQGKLLITQEGKLNIDVKTRRSESLDLVIRGGVEKNSVTTNNFVISTMLEWRIPVL